MNDRKKIMEAKSKLNTSEHFRHIRIYPDKPRWQRQHEANVRLLVKSLGTHKLFIRGNRVCERENHQDAWVNANRGRGGERDQGQGRGRGARRGAPRGNHRGTGRGNRDRGGRQGWSCGFWNVNGWPVDVNTDKYKICSSSILKCDFDICGIAETHLMGHSNPILDGYTVFTNNRKSIHRRAKCGSGGVVLFVKQSVMLHYNVNILDESVEDILWVQFEHNMLLLCINVCVCYLSPDESSHIVDPHSYFDKLLSQIYIYQTRGQFIICGDFNARCGGDADYIEGVDDVIERTIIIIIIIYI